MHAKSQPVATLPGEDSSTRPVFRWLGGVASLHLLLTLLHAVSRCPAGPCGVGELDGMCKFMLDVQLIKPPGNKVPALRLLKLKLLRGRWSMWRLKTGLQADNLTTMPSH